VSRLRRAVAVAALLLAACAPVAHAHQGNPNFRSVLRGLTPAESGVQLSIVNYDDSFELINHSGRTVVVDGYQGEPYARVLPDGTVQLNRNSPAYYLNDDRYGGATVPATASARATPRWETQDGTGRLIWHDHRMHWMGRNVPPAVKDKGVRTKIFDYSIPLRVDGRPAAIKGTLFWVGEPGGGMPVAAIVALLALAAGSLALVVVVRRRRAAQPGGADDRAQEPDRDTEAW
jgi:hypothetical protein